MSPDHQILFIAAAAAIILAAATTVSGTSSLCIDSRFPKVCNKFVLQTDTPNTASTNILQLLLRKTATAKAITEKLEAKSQDKLTKNILGSCIESYDDAFYNLQKSLTAMQNKIYVDLNSDISAALSDVDDCNEAFVGGEDSPIGNVPGSGRLANPLEKINARLFKLLSTLLHVSNQIIYNMAIVE